MSYPLPRRFRVQAMLLGMRGSVQWLVRVRKWYRRLLWFRTQATRLEVDG